FADEKRGWAAGDIDLLPAIWETVDGGDSWTVALSWPRVYEDSTGALLCTRDGGKTWTREATPALHGLTPCAMAATSTTLFVIANPGHLLERPLH
ncbi:MAG TPA: hypothetical protein VMJ34_11260, partial [Bryobacteraceae bacterium]|nr:hypothetical protein [Bryobacteraceae bacterium]